MDILDIAIAKQLAGGGGGSGTDNYNDLSNLPKINDVTLSGNKTSANLGLQSEINSDSKLASDLVDDTNQDNKFVTSAEKTTWNGKQNAIDADHKINADYVDDSTSTNKFVTASDKETWNAKQNAIDNSHKLSSDLVDDTNKTNKFVTSTEKQTWNAKQNAIDADHKLSSSLVSFSEAEAAAIASGIDSSKVAQISTNQSNILYAINTGVKNIIDFSTGQITPSVETRGVTWTISENKGVVANGTSESTGSYPVFCKMTLPVGTYKISGGTSRIKVQLGTTIDSGSGATLTVTSSTSQPINFAVVAIANTTFSNETIYPMVCTEEAWNQSHDYMPPALPNYDLTYLQAEDRASLAEVVDSGAKNLFDVPSSATIDTITWTADSNSYITASPNNTDTRGWGYNPSQYKLNLKAGTYVCVLDIKTASSQSGLGLAMYSSSGTNIFSSAISQIQNKTGIVTWEFTISTAGSYGIEFKCYDMVARIMVATKAAFGVSNKFVPYRPNYDLVCSTLASVTKNTQTINASYTLISNLTYTSTPNTIARIAAIAMNTGKVPTGIIISRSNQASQFENASNLIAKSEASYDCRQLQTDAIVTDGSATTYYIWAKVSEANSTMVKLVTQIIGYTS